MGYKFNQPIEFDIRYSLMVVTNECGNINVLYIR